MKLIFLSFSFAILASFNIVCGQYLYEAASSPYQEFNVSVPGSPFLLNIADNDVTLMSKTSNVYNVKDGQDYLASIYTEYLMTGVYDGYLVHCHKHYHKSSKITPELVFRAISNSIADLKAYIEADKEVARSVDQTRFASRFMAQLAIENRFSELISENLIKFNCINKLQASIDLPKIGLAHYVPAKTLSQYSPISCLATKNIKLNCNFNSKYPSYDASCNNMYNPQQGMAYSCHKRILPASYSDGIKTFRKSINGQELPSARLISNFLLPDVEEVNHEATQMSMQWGQSVVHDQARTPIHLANAPLCCPPQSSTHPECGKVSPLPEGDSLTKRWNQTCLRQVRTTSCSDCSLGPRNALNAATMTLDLSHLYGYTYNDALQHRTFQNGQLTTRTDAAGGDIMPTASGWFDPLTLQACNIPQKFPEFKCFKNGDGTRGSQHPGINALQTLLLRRHNQHALALSQVNPHWTDEQLYLEARRILSAEANHITYNEYVDSIFSPELVAYFKFKPVKNGYSKYDPNVDVSTFTDWSAAAGRFGHSQINSIFHVKNANGEVFTFNMRDVFFEASLIHLGQAEGIIKGLITEPTMHVDPFFITDIKDFMYQNPNRTSGLDLLVLNILRGRDHGLAPYISYLDYCFSYKVKSWEDLNKYIPERQVERFKKVYSDYRDIDLYVGGVSERRLAGNALGPTFACINGMQWYHSKFGDRYYYEHGGQAGSFNEAQLQNIKSTTSLARLICKTATSIRQVQPNVFKLPNNYNNQEIPCEHYPELDYNLFKDEGMYKK